jgi:Putative death-receptor fusion protein (DUF2428)
VRGAGQQLLDALLVLKHQGAIATAASGFQAVCEALLCTQGTSEHSTALAQLPSMWMNDLLARLTGDGQEVRTY